MRKHTIWTDGSCLGNPGYGGWAAIFFKSAFGMDYPNPHNRLCGSEANTTNNRMELTAIINALDAVEDSSHIRVITDSAYCADGATLWYKRWIDRKWKGVANVDLWHQLLDSINKHKLVEFKLVKGHNRIFWNEEADDIAKASAKARKELEVGNLERYNKLIFALELGEGFRDLAK